MTPPVEILELKGETPLAQGRMRIVFRHPRDPGLLVKVIRPDILDKRWGSGAPWYKKRRRFGQYISYIRETEEYIAGCAGGSDAPPFAQKIVGYVDTDYGLGMIVRAVLDRNGDPAPTLGQILLRGGYDAKVKADLATFVDSVVNSDLIVADFNLHNIVHGHDEQHGDHFVLIDGLGLSTILPFKTLSRAFNRLSKKGRVKRMYARIERNLRMIAAGGAS
ncbi:YrbL family protein [Luteolibacter sp. SL250]|uniref:YrbL family protein n=1 Tax=Luteolibacter sp. SL250 TaxID=2995170 RepID=UPI0022717126|nr:YrbL family protein [Luteolibacter sp. SL250]WAC20179.1 YrbL family protein [Luteolibacter sp. SL250]